MGWSSTPTIGQLEQNSCWAACLAWWLKSVQGGRPSWTQKEVMAEYWRNRNSDGGINSRDLPTVWGSDQRLRMKLCEWPTPDETLESLPLGSKPVIIAFKHRVGFAHMNVIWRSGPGVVMCMEPFFPNPGVDGKRTGRLVARDYDHFNAYDYVILGWPIPDSGRYSETPEDAG